MTERISFLREKSLNAEVSISAERAVLLTEFYQQQEVHLLSVPVQRALAFDYFLQNKKIFIDYGELIVGERGEKPKATPTYPEICLHSLEDLKNLNDREKTRYSVSDDVFEVYEQKIIPFWKGKSMREKIFNAMTPEWIEAYQAGIFTEFMEQRAPGHTVLDGKIYHQGMYDFIRKIDFHLKKLDLLKDNLADEKAEELKAMKIAARALIKLAGRYSRLAKKLAKIEKDTQRKKELLQISEICARVPAYAPENLYEALQYYWFVHLGVICEYNTWDSFNPGRLDQHLFPFYKNDIETGRLTREDVYELLEAFWIKFNNQPAPPKVGVTAAESGTYTDFCLINLGGLTPEGKDAVNEISFILLDVIEEMRLLQPSSMIQVSVKNPDHFIRRALKIIRTGFGQPSIFNSDAIVKELLRQGKTLIDARCGGASGCVEAGAFGKESYILTGYFNLVKILELTLNNGKDMLTGKTIGLKTGDFRKFKDFSSLLAAYKKQLNHFIDIKLKGNLHIERLYARYLPAPFLSLLIDDCIEKAKDYNAGGARYNSSYVQGVGIGTVTDALSALKTFVYEQNKFSLEGILKMLKENFQGFEEQRLLLFNRTPRYGNADPQADCIMEEVFEAFFCAVDGKPNSKGGHFRINMLPTTCHIYFGKKCAATADGRKAFQPLSEGISPVQSTDRNGPTAVILSASRMDQLKTGGTLLNMKFTPDFFQTEAHYEKLIKLIRTYFALDGHHLQFNVISAETLRWAQREPQNYRNLIVRVAGYSDYFVDLSEDLQEEIILRTEHSRIG